MKFIPHPNRQELAQTLAKHIADALQNTLETRQRALLTVPGGTTPGPLFDHLSHIPLPWERVDVILSDERWVAPTHPRSNTALIQQRLLVGPAAKANLLPLYAPTPTPEEAITTLLNQLTPHLPISVALLGMGSDLHTASLFPKAKNLSQALSPNAPALLAITAPGAAEPRITLSAATLNTAAHKYLMITGDKKRAALETAPTTPQHAPIRAVLNNTKVHWAP